MRIPLSQLRFSGADEQTWGLQVQRRIFRQEERSTWQVIPKVEHGLGQPLRRAAGHRRPEAAAAPRDAALRRSRKAERFEERAGQPVPGRRGDGRVVGARRQARGSPPTSPRDFTLNPDFGQVEADPSEVNLTAFETFFEEKRPFFIEGTDIFEVRLAPVDPGRPLHPRPAVLLPPHRRSAAALARPRRTASSPTSPRNSSILGAVKLTGKTAGGLSRRRAGQPHRARERGHRPPRPAPARDDRAPHQLLRRAARSRTSAAATPCSGSSLTSVDRRIDDAAPRVPARARRDRGRRLRATTSATGRWPARGQRRGAATCAGTAEAIDEVQTSSARYFQRPDNDHADYDPTRTSLGGHGGSVRLRRTGENANLSVPDRRRLALARLRDQRPRLHDPGRRDQPVRLGGIPDPQPVLDLPPAGDERERVAGLGFRRTPLRRAVNTNCARALQEQLAAGGRRDPGRRARQQHRAARRAVRAGGRGAGATRPTSTPTSGAACPSGRGHQRPRRRRGQREAARTLWLDLVYRPTNALTVTLSPTVSRNDPELQYVDTVSSGDGRPLPLRAAASRTRGPSPSASTSRSRPT